MECEIVLMDISISETDEFELYPSLCNHSLSIYVGEKSLEEQLKNKKLFNKCIELQKEVIDEDTSDKFKEEIKYLEDNFDNLFDEVEYIRFAFDKKDIKEFIKENPMVLSKKIVVGNALHITDYDELMDIIEEYKDIKDKIYVYLVGNDSYTSLDDCIKTMDSIKKIAYDIKKLGLSPMETIMYTYDLVRNRVYTHENKDETAYKSRDLTEVLQGNKIVCLGYANIFYSLLYFLGYKDNLVVELFEDESKKDRRGHARNVVYVKDDKYDIDGVYYFDPTWDSKRKMDDNSYLYRYRYFAKTKESMDKSDKNKIKDEYFKDYSTDMYEKVEKLILDNRLDELLKYMKSIDYMSQLVMDKYLMDCRYFISGNPLCIEFDSNEFLKDFKEISSKFNKPLSGEVLLKLLNNVRKVQYYQDPSWYPYSLGDLYKTFMNSGWEYSEEHISDASRLLYAIFGEKPETNPIDSFRTYTDEIELQKEVIGVKLAKTLRLALDKKMNDK